jgi:hypothetical protein
MPRHWKPTIFMELRPSWEAASCAATQELPSKLRNLKVHYRVHKSIPLVSILNQITPVHTTPSYIRSVLVLSSHLRLDLLTGLLPFGFNTNILRAFLFAPIRATCPGHLTLFDFVILIIVGEEHKLWSCSICSFLLFPVTSSIRLPFRCHLCPIWPSVIPLNLSYTLIAFLVTVMSESSPHRCLTFHVPNLMSRFL